MSNPSPPPAPNPNPDGPYIYGATVAGAAASTVVLWLLSLWGPWGTAPDAVKGAASTLVIAGSAWMAGRFAHRRKARQAA